MKIEMEMNQSEPNPSRVNINIYLQNEKQYITSCEMEQIESFSLEERINKLFLFVY